MLFSAGDTVVVTRNISKSKGDVHISAALVTVLDIIASNGVLDIIDTGSALAGWPDPCAWHPNSSAGITNPAFAPNTPPTSTHTAGPAYSCITYTCTTADPAGIVRLHW
jgi:hypothetical protein